MSQIAGKRMDPEVCKKLFVDGHDIRYRVMVRGKWSGIRSYRKRVQKGGGVMWPWDMIGSPNISSVEWWVLE
jgi:hypothetical protein